MHAHYVCPADKEATHTKERESVCRVIGATRACDANISPYQRTLIAPSMSEQIHVQKSIHKASPTQSRCPLCEIFLLVLFTKMRLAHIIPFIITLGDINNLHFSRRIHSRGIHAKQTVTTLLHRRYTHIHKAFPTGAVTHMPVHQRQSLDT